MKVLLSAILVGLVLAGCATTPSDSGAQGSTPDATSTAGQTRDAGPSASRYYVDAVNSWDDAERAISLLDEAIAIDPDFALAYFERANRNRKLGRDRAALEDLTAAIDADPGFLQAYRARYDLRVHRFGEQEGIEDLQRAYAIDPDHLDTALTYANHLAWKEPSQAIGIYDRLVSVYPDESAPYLSRAKFHRDRGAYGRALEDLRQAVRAGDRSGWVRADLIWMQVATGRREEARSSAGQLLAEEPEAKEAALVAARVAALDGESDRALRLYERYFAGEWTDPTVWLEVAVVAAATGDADGAGRALEQYRAQKDDRDRAQTAQLATMALLGQRERALGGLEAMTGSVDWYLGPWVVRSLVEQGEQAQTVRSSLREIAAERDGGLAQVLVTAPEVWIFSRLYLAQRGVEDLPGLEIP